MCKGYFIKKSLCYLSPNRQPKVAQSKHRFAISTEIFCPAMQIFTHLRRLYRNLEKLIHLCPVYVFFKLQPLYPLKNTNDDFYALIICLCCAHFARGSPPVANLIPTNLQGYYQSKYIWENKKWVFASNLFAFSCIDRHPDFFLVYMGF